MGGGVPDGSQDSQIPDHRELRPVSNLVLSVDHDEEDGGEDEKPEWLSLRQSFPG